jgi:predicted Fe-Mo cluster-binding NifX family protein
MMKIAVSSTGPTLDSAIDARFGRAEMFLIIDDATDDFSIVGNKQNMDAAQGAGIQAARLVSDSGAELVITGHCGPKAFQTLRAAGIEIIVGVQGMVQEALDKYKAGQLASTDSPDVRGHWM